MVCSLEHFSINKEGHGERWPVGDFFSGEGVIWAAAQGEKRTSTLSRWKSIRYVVVPSVGEKP